MFYEIFIKYRRYPKPSSKRKIKRVFSAEEKQELSGRVFRKSRLDYIDFSATDLREARFEDIDKVSRDGTARTLSASA